MKKPKTIESAASGLQSDILGCKKAQVLVTITKAAFDEMWNLAKEAMHTNAATSVPESAEDRDTLE